MLPHLGFGRQGIPQGDVEDDLQGDAALRCGSTVLGLCVSTGRKEVEQINNWKLEI